MPVWFFAAAAWASPIFPTVLAEEAGTPCTPVPCTVCHETALGGAGTVTRAFGLALIDQGLVPGDEEALADAFAALAAEGIDSDGDGTSDADELASGLDPNPDGLAFCDQAPPPVYGCFSHTGVAPTAALALLGLLVVRRRRPRGWVDVGGSRGARG